MSYFTPPCNKNAGSKGGHVQSTTSHTAQPPSGGNSVKSPPPMKQGASIPPPPGAMRSSGQTVLQCPQCGEILPTGKDLPTHFIGCGAAAIGINGFTPFSYPQPSNTGFHQPPPNYGGRSGARK